MPTVYSEAWFDLEHSAICNSYKAGELAVLLTIHEWHRCGGRYCAISARSIARQTRLTQTSVASIVARLKKKGVLSYSVVPSKGSVYKLYLSHPQK
jgi:DNA-binding MarR family transcriptional regulator